MIGIKIISGGIGKKILSINATIERKNWEYLDLDCFSIKMVKFWNIIFGNICFN